MKRHLAATTAIANKVMGKLAVAFVISGVLHSTAIAADSADLVAEFMPSVVHIRIAPYTNLAKPDQKENSDKGIDSSARKPFPMGSGTIISADGYIVTVGYLFDDGTEIQVATHDGKKYPAVLVGREKRSEIALLKINATGLKAAKIADSSKSRTGQQVLAAGLMPESLRYEPIVTNGIISVNARDDGESMPLIQTTAPITPIMGGGGLFNTNGEIVGVMARTVQNNGRYIGVSFAIPIDEAMRVIFRIKLDVKLEKP